MFDWVGELWESICYFIITIIKWILNLPVNLINCLIDLWYWMREETLNALGKLLFDSFSVLASLAPFPLNVNQETLHSFYVNANIFFPVDDLVTLAVFLLETWVMVKVARYSVFLALIFFKPRKPKLSIIDSSGG